MLTWYSSIFRVQIEYNIKQSYVHYNVRSFVAPGLTEVVKLLTLGPDINPSAGIYT